LGGGLGCCSCRVGGVVRLAGGASAGGFSEVRLARGARRVYAVDVGHGQLSAKLAGEPRIVSLEGCDARRLDTSLIPEPVGAVVADVSFISLAKVLAVPLSPATRHARLGALRKPPIDVGRAGPGQRGNPRGARPPR